MNYSEMSGYEINTRIHNIVACEGKYDLKVEGYKVTWTERETGRVIETLRKQYDKEFKDYLSSWADAGAIIQRHKISLIWVKTEIPNRWDAGSPCHMKWATHEYNPLRAAMETFLLMQEQSNA